MTQQIPAVDSTAALYDLDYQQWLETTIAQLRSQDFTAVDWENLLEELDSLSRRDKREARSRMTLILIHLLKWVYQPQMREFYGNSWVSTIVVQRNDLNGLLSDSPSLNGYLTQEFAECYAIARKSAAKETGLAQSAFPPESPFTLEQVLDPDFWPE